MTRPYRMAPLLLGSALLVTFYAGRVAAEPRVALVIGNGAYRHVGALTNPPADARLIATTLEGLRFSTRLLVDADQTMMKQAIAGFGRDLREAGREAVGLFYFAGHGVQAVGRNYLMPVEANPSDEADLDLVGIDASWILNQVESARNSSNIIILDACRNNPFAAATRSASRGLARLDAPTGSFIAYATAPGQTALDGDGAHSPFTLALAKALPAPGLPIEQVFKQVRVAVLQATQGRQTPWDSSSLVQDVYFNQAPMAPTAPQVGSSGPAGQKTEPPASAVAGPFVREPSATGVGSPRCARLLQRAQIGERLNDEDQRYLRGTCR